MTAGQLAEPDDVQLCAGPAYHAAPLAFDVRSSMVMGIPLVFIDRWDSEGVLKTIEKYKVTRAHLVPIMFQRLLNLPDEVRGKYDVSSLRYIIHGAAPCPPEVKKAMIDWVGPIINEYYAGSEGGAGFVVSSEEWLKKPGTVGKLPDPSALQDPRRRRPRGGAGRRAARSISRSRRSRRSNTTRTRPRPPPPTGATTSPWATSAILDEDGYLFLTGRTAECIISGGVNIYPQEIDNELIKHPAVEDACTIGVPNEEWGEEVKSVADAEPRLRRQRRPGQGHPGLGPRTPGRLQGPALDRVRRRTAPQPRRQDPAQEGARALLGGTRAVDLSSRDWRT